MRVIKPIDTTPASLQSSTIQEPDITNGEKEWEAVPSVGFDISDQGGVPIRLIKRVGVDKFDTFDLQNGVINKYDAYFNFTNDPSSFSTFGEAIGGSTLSNVTFTTITGNDANNWALEDFNEYGSRLLAINLKALLNAAGISNLDPVGVFSKTSDTSNRVIYILNKISSSQYRVIVYDFQARVLLSNSLINTATHGTPVDIISRRGDFMVLFSTAAKTTLAFYNDLFSSELSAHVITGDTSDQPYDSITVDSSDGYYFLKTSSLRVFSVTSGFKLLSAYGVGEQVIKSSNHKKYQCLIETTTDPEQGVDLVPPTWFEVGATNKFAMFDGINTYQSLYGTDVEIVVRPIGVISSIAIFNIENVNSVMIKMEVPDAGMVFEQTYGSSGKEDLIAPGLPPFENPIVTINFYGTDIKVGEVVMGTEKELGVLLSGAISDRIDYSRYTYDEFGNLNYVPRPIVKYTTYPIRIAKKEAPSIERYLDDLKGAQAVWIGDIGGGDYLVTRGTIERSPMTYDSPVAMEYQIKVRGSI